MEGSDCRRKYLAFAAGAANHAGLWVRQVATRSDLQLIATAPGSFEGLTFSPDGNYIYWRWDELRASQSGQLFRIPRWGESKRH